MAAKIDLTAVFTFKSTSLSPSKHIHFYVNLTVDEISLSFKLMVFQHKIAVDLPSKNAQINVYRNHRDFTSQIRVEMVLFVYLNAMKAAEKRKTTALETHKKNPKPLLNCT